MKKFILTITLFSFGIAAAQKIEKKLGEFNRLKTYDAISVKLVKAKENKAIITGHNTDKVQLVNKNGLLKIKLDLENTLKGEETFVELHYTDLYLLDANEGSYITGDVLNAYDVELKAQEGAEIRIGLDTKKALIKVVSGSKIIATGKAKNQDVIINSGGMFRGKDLVTEQTTVSVSAGGNAKVNATEIVKAKVKAGGNIKIYGNPRVIDKKTVFGGNIKEVN